LVGPGEFEVRSRESLDAHRPVGSVTLTRPGEEIGAADRARGILRTSGVVSIAHEMVGGAATCLALSLDYVRAREQFGHPVGAYQAVSHQCVDMFISIEVARSLATYAAWAVSEGHPEQEVAASRAHVAAYEAARLCAERTIQVHGGMGMTHEHSAHRFLTRAITTAKVLQPVRASRHMLAARLAAP